MLGCIAKRTNQFDQFTANLFEDTASIVDLVGGTESAVVAVGYTSETIRNLSSRFSFFSNRRFRFGSVWPGLVTCTQIVPMSPPSLVGVQKLSHILTVW